MSTASAIPASREQTSPAPRLLDVLQQATAERGHSVETIRAHVDWTTRFILFHGMRHPSDFTNAEEFRSYLGDYARLYAFLSQIITFTDADLEKLYQFGRLLLRKLPVNQEQLPVEIQQNIDMDSYRLQQTSSGKLPLEKGTHPLEPLKGKQVFGPQPEQIEPLSAILKDLNERFGTDFTEADKVIIEHLESRLNEDAALQTSVKVNVPENARLTFDLIANDKIQELIETHFKFYKQINDDAKFSRFFLDWLFERYLKRSRGQEEGNVAGPLECGKHGLLPTKNL